MYNVYCSQDLEPFGEIFILLKKDIEGPHSASLTLRGAHVQ